MNTVVLDVRSLGQTLSEASRAMKTGRGRLGLAVDGRDYAVGAQILRELGVRTMRLMTNNPRKYEGLANFGLGIRERVPLLSPPRAENMAYLKAKEIILGHMLGLGLSTE